MYLEGAVLKPNMVKPGLANKLSEDLVAPATAEEVAKLTVQALLRTVPPAMPGIFFLSGDMPLNCDNEETATIHLSTMNKLHPTLPWHLAFSYGKALQKTAIVTWATTKSDEATQKALLARAKANSEATYGKYVPGSCASVGVDGNIKTAGGGY